MIDPHLHHMSSFSCTGHGFASNFYTICTQLGIVLLVLNWFAEVNMDWFSGFLWSTHTCTICHLSRILGVSWFGIVCFRSSVWTELVVFFLDFYAQFYLLSLVLAWFAEIDMDWLSGFLRICLFSCVQRFSWLGLVLFVLAFWTQLNLVLFVLA